MIRKVRLTLCAALFLAAALPAEDYKGAVITKVNKTKATLKVDDKDVQVTLGSGAKVFDANGKELKGSDRARILKEDNEVNVTTAKGKREEVIEEIHLVKGELAPAAVRGKGAPGGAGSGTGGGAGGGAAGGLWRPTKTLTPPKSDWDKLNYKDARVGDFVEFVDGNGRPVLRVEVTEVGDHFVVKKTTNIVRGRLGDPITTEIVVAKLSFTAPEPKYKSTLEEKTSQSSVMVGDTQLPATLTEFYDKSGKLVSKKWVSPEVPLGGTVREEKRDGKLVTTLAKFGRGK
jgi:hypothetical protein